MLDLQRQNNEEFKRESERVANLLIQIAETQKAIQKRYFIGIIAIGILIASGIGLGLSLMLADRYRQWTTVPMPMY